MLNRVSMVSIQRRTKAKKEIPDISRRQCTVRYTGSGEDKLLQVCRRTFMRLFSLSNSRLQLIIEYEGKVSKKGEKIAFVSKNGENPKSHMHFNKFGGEKQNSVTLHVM